MLPREVDGPFDDDGWLFEPSWDGLRVLAHVEDDRLRLLDARGREVTARFPDLLGLIDAVVGAPLVLGGEIAVPDARGAPDPVALRRRLRAVEGGRTSKGGSAPATYLVDDLLYFEGRSLLREPLARRREKLATTVRPGPRVVALPAVRGEGTTLFEAIERQGLPGMLARRADSPYLPGVRSDLWRHVRTERRHEVVVGGYAPRADGSVGLLLGAWERHATGSPSFVAVGATEAPARSELAPTLQGSLRRISDPVTPFRRGARAGYRWVRPELVVTVAHRGWSEERLVEPQLVAVRDELDAGSCRVPEPGPEGEPGAATRRPVLALLQKLPLGER